MSKKNGHIPEIAGQSAPVVCDSVTGAQVLPWQQCVAGGQNGQGGNGQGLKGLGEMQSSLRTRARDWVPCFLENLRLYGVWTVACDAARISPDTADKIRLRNSKFAHQCEQAIRASTDLLEASIIVRGRDGWTEPVFGKAANGEPVMVGKVRKYDGNLAIAAMRARRPEVWRENHNVEMSGPGGAPLPGQQVQIVIAGAVRASDPAPIEAPAQAKQIPDADTQGGS